MRDTLGCGAVSQRRACRVLGQPRSTQRHEPKVRDDEPPWVKRIVELARRFGRYGYRRVTAIMRGEGWRVNHKRVERIWRQEGLKVPQRQPKRGRLGLNDGSCVRLGPTHQAHVWSDDFVHDRTQDGRALGLLTFMDEYPRECLCIDVARKLNHEDVLERLAYLFVTRGVRQHIRSDHGSEFTAAAVRDWLGKVGVKTLSIEWENGSIESFNGKLRDELLTRKVFETLLEAKVLIEGWRIEYNTVRPHSSLGYTPHAPEAIASCMASYAPLRQPYMTIRN